MLRGRGSTIMTFLMASRRGLSLVTSFPGRLTTAPPAAAAVSSLVDSNTNLLRTIYTARAASEGCGTTRLLVAPLSMAAACSGSSETPNNNSSTSKRKPRHAPSSTEGVTKSPSGARRRLTPDAAATGGGPGAAGPRKAAWGASAGPGERGWGQASSYGASGGGRGGRGPSRGESSYTLQVQSHRLHHLVEDVYSKQYINVSLDIDVTVAMSIS